MDLKTFLAPMSAQQRDDFANRCGTTRGHLQNVMYGQRPFADWLAANVEMESKGLVTCEESCASLNWLRIKDKSWPNPKGRPVITPVKKPEAVQGA